VKTFVLLAFVGLGAQLVDGSLGMAYGVTSTTLLLAIGTNPAAASATVHLAEIGTSLLSGLAHWRFGNVDWKVVAKIGVPGAVGAFVGAQVLSSLSTEVAAPSMSLVLLALGAAQGDRLDRHLGVPRRAGCKPRLPAVARLARCGLQVGAQPAGRRHGGRTDRRVAGAPRPAIPARHARGRNRRAHQHPRAAQERLDRRHRPGAVRPLRGYLRALGGAVVYSYLRYRKNRTTESAAALAAPRSG
jgi:hypothetical protein